MIILHSFGGKGDGGGPANLIMSKDGRFLYGTIQYGGAYNCGTIFQVALDDSDHALVTILKSFQCWDSYQIAELFLKIQSLPTSISYLYVEPSNWSDIINNVNNRSVDLAKINKKNIFDKLYGGILGKCIGCLLGKPIEGWAQQKIISFLRETGNFPIKKFLIDNIDISYYARYKIMNYLIKMKTKKKPLL